MWPRFGIKVGGSTLCSAYIEKGGDPKVIVNTDGERVSHACLLWLGDDKFECGLAAKRKLELYPNQVAAHTLQLLQPLSDLNKRSLPPNGIPCKYDWNSNIFVLQLSAGGSDNENKSSTYDISASEILTRLLRREFELTKSFYIDKGDGPPIAVLSIPAHLPKGSLDLVQNAAIAAGFLAAAVIREPVAAMSAYGICDNISIGREYSMTIKCGSFYSHFCLFSVNNGFYTQLDSYGPFALGGSNFTNVLVTFICEELHRIYSIDPANNKQAMSKILMAANDCKHQLTSLLSTQFCIGSLMDGINVHLEITRTRFEEIIQPVVHSFMQILTNAVDEALQKHSQIEGLKYLVLLGGGLLIPKLKSTIEDFYNDTEILSGIKADEVAAVGCAHYTRIIENPRST